MLNALIALFVNLLLVGPFETGIGERLARARAPADVISQVSACAAAAVPVLVQRVTDDPWWGARTAFVVWVDGTPPEQVMRDVTPACSQAVAAATSFLGAQAT